MPDPAEVRFYGIDADWPAYRVWWSSNVTYPEAEKPEPGALPLSDTEEG